MHQDWICSVKWVQANYTNGAWFWTMWFVDEGENDEPKLTKVAEGVALNKLGVYWRVWRQCRKHGLRFRPNVRGTIEG